MVKCGCASDRCSCTIIPGDGVDIAGTGSASNPYVITAIPVEAAGTGDASGRFSGEVTTYAGAIAPTGWLTCDGSAVSRTVYASLFAAVGIAFGAGDGSTTFNLPKLTDRFAVGAGGSHPRGSQNGALALTPGHLPIHSHTMNHTHPTASTTADGVHDHATYHRAVEGTSSTTFNTADTDGRVSDNNLVQSAGSHSHSVTLPAFTGRTGDSGHDTDILPFEPPNTALLYIIKV